MQRQPLALVVLFILAAALACKNECSADGTLSDEWRRAVVRVQPFRAGEREKGSATGFLYWDYARRGESVLLVTCRHVLESEDSLTIWFNTTSGDSSPRGRLLPRTVPLINRAQNDTLWIGHPGDDIDVAVVRVERPDSEHWHHVINIAMSRSTMLPKDSLSLGQELAYWGFPAIFGDNTWPTPLLRMGTVAEKDCFNSHCLFVEAWALPGNSGSPVFRREQSLYVYENGKLTGELVLQPKLVGIISAFQRTGDIYFDYEGRPAVRLPQHSGITTVYTFDAIEETIERLNREKP